MHLTFVLVIYCTQTMSGLSTHVRRWAVIGAGPCGIGVVGRLVDLGHHVTWIDPAFQVGRMGPYYRNVPANTLNGDLLVATRMCESFQFEETQQRRRAKGEVVMADQALDQCFDLGYLVNFLEDATEELKKKVDVVQGKLVSLKRQSVTSSQWTYEVLPTIIDNAKSTTNPQINTIFNASHLLSGEVDGVINVCGCKPVAIPGFPEVIGSQPAVTRQISHPQSASSVMTRDITFHSLDLTVDPVHIAAQMQSTPVKESHWVVVGSSHSGMLVVKNLIEAGVRPPVTVIHRSPIRFMTFKENGCKKYQGTGLKGPVGEWVRHQLQATSPAFNLIQYDASKTWEEQLIQIGADHVVTATGFIRDDIASAAEINRSDHVSSGKFKVFVQTDTKNAASAPSSSAAQEGKTLTEVQLVDYDKWTGLLSFTPPLAHTISGIFGGGIAYPQNHRDEEGDIEPWVGFKRSIEQTDLMIETLENSFSVK